MATLYEIDARIMECVNDETGEIENPEKLEALYIERSLKIENVALWVKNLESDAKAIKAEKAALDKRMKSAEKKAESLKKWLTDALCCLPFATPRVSISFKASTTTEVNEATLPQKWCVEKVTYTPDKNAIKEALMTGEKIEGACLVAHQNIQIK